MEDCTSRWNGWTRRGKIEAERASDPLLAYLTYARGADEHDVEDISEGVPGGLTFGAKPGAGEVHLRRMEVRPGFVMVDASGPMDFRWEPARLALRDVENRGRKYPVPTTHRGQPLTSTSVREIGDAGLKYYEEVLQEIEARFSADLAGQRHR